MYYSFIMLKPDALKQEFVETILQYFKKAEIEIERLGYKKVSEPVLKQHYAEIIQKLGTDFKDKLMLYFDNEFVMPMVLKSHSEHIISDIRTIVGATDPSKAAPGTIRGDLGTDSLAQCIAENRSCYNLIHASDCPEAVKREIGIWFGNDVAEQYG